VASPWRRPPSDSLREINGAVKVDEGCSIYETEARSIDADAAADNVWTKVTGKSITRQPKPRPDVIIIEPNEKMSYADILNLVTRNESDNL